VDQALAAVAPDPVADAQLPALDPHVEAVAGEDEDAAARSEKLRCRLPLRASL
jgi:hypothetical protein